MTEAHRWEVGERPAIFISLAPDVDEKSARWVMIGAEEEGVPCQVVAGASHDAVTLAYLAAQGSRINVGVGIGGGKIALQEAHMPADKPVLLREINDQALNLCRMFGSNAGRMVKHMPLRFSEDVFSHSSEPVKDVVAPVTSPPAPVEQSNQPDNDLLAQIIERVLKQRGLA